MAEDQINSVVDIEAIKAEISTAKSEVDSLVKHIKAVKATNINLSGAKSVSEFNALRKELDLLIKQTNLSAKAAIDEAKAREASAKAAIAEAKAANEVTKGKALEEKARIANQKAAEAEAKAIEKTNVANSDLSARPIESIPFEIKTNTDAVTDLGDAVSDVEKQQAEAVITANEWAESQRKAADVVKNESAEAAAIYKDDLERLTGTLSENEGLMKIYKAELSQVQGELKLMDKTTAASEKSTASYRNKVADLTATETKLKGEVKDLGNTIKNQNIQNTAAAGSIDQLRARYALLLREIERGGVAFKQSAVGKSILLETRSVKTALDTAERQAFLFRGSLSNTGSAITGFFGKAFGVLKNLANIIPGLGIGTLIGIVADTVIDFTRTLVGAGKSTIELAEAQIELSKRITETNDAIQNQIDLLSDQYGSGIDLLKSQLSLLEKSGASSEQIFLKKKELLEAENDLNDKALGLQIKRAENENVNFGNSITGYDALNNAIVEHRDNVERSTQSIINLEDEKNEKIRLGAGLEDDTIKKLDKRIEAEKSTLNAEKKIFGDYYGAAKKSFDSQNALDELTLERRKKLSDDQKKIADSNRKALFEILKLDLEIRADFANEIVKDDKKSYSERLLALNDYAKAKQELIDATAEYELSNTKLTSEEIRLIEKKRIDASLRLAHSLSDAIKRTVIDFKEAAPAFAGAVDGMTKSISAAIEAINKKNAELKDGLEKNAKAIKDAVKELAAEVSGLLFDLFTNDIDREKNAIQERIDLLDREKQKEIELVNQSIASAQDKAAAIAVIQARSAAQKEQLERKQRELDQRKARFERAEAIVNIIANTARGITAALASVPPNPVLAAIVGAIGAVQLARTLAQPIPKFAEGGVHEGGPMIVGDANKHEGIVLPDGSVLKSPARSTLMDAPAGTVIHPDYDRMMLNATMTKVPVFNVKTSSDGTKDAIKQMSKDVVRAIKGQPQTIIKAPARWKRFMKTGSTFKDYLD